MIWQKRQKMRQKMQKFLKRINNVKIMKKLMVIYMVGGLIPLLVISIYFSTNTRNILIERATQEAVNNTIRVEERLKEIFRIATNVSDGLYLDKKLENLVQTQYSDPMQVIRDLNNYTLMDDYLRSYVEIESIRFYVQNDTLLDDSQIIKAKESDISSDWYQSAIEKDGRMLFIYKYDEIHMESFMAVVRLVKSSEQEPLGVLVVNMSNRYLGRIIQSEPYQMMMILDNKTIILATDHDQEGKQVHRNSVIGQVLQMNLEVVDTTYNSEETKAIVDIFRTEKTSNDLALITFIPVENLLEEANAFIKNALLIIGISLLLAILMVYFLAKAFSDRINLFRQEMHQVAAGDFALTSKVDGKDELGQLSNDLNIMTQSIQKLIHEAYEVKLQKEQLTSKQREAEFKMLASQINPHFLYNALETIRMKAHINQQKDIAEVVKKLAKIMRRNLSVAQDEVTLDSEIELVQHYLEIQKFRFGEKISFELDIKCPTEKYKILPLLLQPLVENAIIHGIERKIGNGHVIIRFLENDKYLIVSVIDDGMGIDEKKLAAIQYRLEKDIVSKDGSIGLTNVNQRVKIFYGDAYHMAVESVDGRGTIVKLLLPSAKYREEATDVYMHTD